jgi:hypothetical protein
MTCNNDYPKLDGTLHKLCEFHRRKANLSQQRLHKRHRDERAALRRANTAVDEVRPAKRTQLTVQIPVSVDPIPFSFTGALFDANAAAEESQDKLFVGHLAPEDIELLLLLDEINAIPNSPSAVDDISSCK